MKFKCKIQRILSQIHYPHKKNRRDFLNHVCVEIDIFLYIIFLRGKTARENRLW